MENSPVDSKGFFNKGLELNKQQKYEQAIKFFDEAIKVDKKSEEYNNNCFAIIIKKFQIYNLLLKK